jgi:hypothetical protein
LIALLPTSYDNLAGDDVVVTAYDNQTGRVSFDKPLNFHHWGSNLSTAQDYNGVDMRGEVITLSRNIKIRGTDEEDWGGMIITTDSVEFDSSMKMTIRNGITILDNVEVYNCSRWR